MRYYALTLPRPVLVVSLRFESHQCTEFGRLPGPCSATIQTSVEGNGLDGHLGFRPFASWRLGANQK